MLGPLSGSDWGSALGGGNGSVAIGRETELEEVGWPVVVSSNVMSLYDEVENPEEASIATLTSTLDSTSSSESKFPTAPGRLRLKVIQYVRCLDIGHL
jgi:hypothetical protein